jgi:hypothetical protein
MLPPVKAFNTILVICKYFLFFPHNVSKFYKSWCVPGSTIYWQLYLRRTLVRLPVMQQNKNAVGAIFPAHTAFCKAWQITISGLLFSSL